MNEKKRTTTTERVLVTPQVATEMLAKNTGNRPMSDAKVKRLATKMVDGAWVFTHQGIGIDWNGTLIDGQHRLSAVVESNTAVEFLVTSGLDPSAYDHVDGVGMARTASDLLAHRLPDSKYRKRLCGAGNAMMQGVHNPNLRIDNMLTVEFVEWYHDLLAPFVDVLLKTPSRVISAPVIAAFCNAVRGVDEWPGGHGRRASDDVMLIAMRFSAMEWDGPTDPLRKLFVKLSNAAPGNASRTGSSLSANEVYRLATSAIRAELKEAPLGHLYATDIEWGEKGDSGKMVRLSAERAFSGRGVATQDVLAAAHDGGKAAAVRTILRKVENGGAR